MTTRIVDRRVWQWDGRYSTYDDMCTWMGRTDTVEGAARGLSLLSKPRRVEFTFASGPDGRCVTIPEGTWVAKHADGTFGVTDPPGGGAG